MPRGNQKSRTKRKVRVRTPGGRLVTHFSPRRHKAPTCVACGRPLLGIPRRSSLSEGKGVPKRPFGGMLCSVCMRERIKTTKGV